MPELKAILPPLTIVATVAGVARALLARVFRFTDLAVTLPTVLANVMVLPTLVPAVTVNAPASKRVPAKVVEPVPAS